MTFVDALEMMKSIFEPKPDINYNVIALLYGIGSILSLFFLCLEKYLGSEVTS